MDQAPTNESKANYGLAWLLLSLSLGAHVWDEAVHGYLDYHNATVITLWAHFSWFPKMDMEYSSWLWSSVGIAALLLLLTPLAYRNARWMRPLAYLFAALQLLNGLAHLLFTLLGHTVPSVVFDGPAPGVYSAPLLIVFSAFLFWRLQRTAKLETASP